jgi:signal transduction histidine kinase
LIQILLNLIDNAIKYSPTGEPITLRLEALDHCAQLSVSDRGIGIPIQHQARIFERFYRVEAARAPGGSGLGLAIVKTLVEGMGGKIQVRSKLGEGSTFTVCLPLTSPSTAHNR